MSQRLQRERSLPHFMYSTDGTRDSEMQQLNTDSRDLKRREEISGLMISLSCLQTVTGVSTKAARVDFTVDAWREKGTFSILC